ncbi:MAG TPA: hypothetical protein ENN06_11455 [Desulfobacteraceae bacterium]|nr:hypothetical protein [Desulfobacteraceae bacterium]
MAPRFLFFLLAGLTVYLSLSLYHGQQVKKLSAPAASTGINAPSANDRERNWIQVTTRAGKAGKNSVSDGDSDPAGLPVRIGIQGPPLPAVTQDPAALRTALEQEKMKADSLARENENLLFRLGVLQAELEEARSLLRKKEEELQHALSSGTEAADRTAGKIDTLSRQLLKAEEKMAQADAKIGELDSLPADAQKNGQQNIAAVRGVLEELARSRQEREQYLAEIGRLDTLLKKTKSRLIAAESEITRSRLKAEAMLYYDRGKDRPAAPFRQETDTLQARLADMQDSLARSERRVADLRMTEQRLRLRIDGGLTDAAKAEPLEATPDPRPTADE